MSDWKIENFTFENATKPTIFHTHEEIDVFVIQKNTCPLCDEEVPNHLLIQSNIIDDQWINTTNMIFKNNEFLVWVSRSEDESSYNLDCLFIIQKINKLLQNYGKYDFTAIFSSKI